MHFDESKAIKTKEKIIALTACERREKGEQCIPTGKAMFLNKALKELVDASIIVDTGDKQNQKASLKEHDAAPTIKQSTRRFF
jgi:hypothetical protein